MSRTIADAKLETRAARDRLALGKKPHWRTLLPSKLHLGYRRRHRDAPGQWLVRHYLGDEKYHIAPLGVADDFIEGVDVLTFAEAQRAALAHRVTHHTGKTPTVADAFTAYCSHLMTERPAAAANTSATAQALILPTLGRHKLHDLSTAHLLAWRNELAQQPARIRTRAGEPQRTRPASSPEAQRARRASVNRVTNVLKAALNYAFKNGLTESDLPWRRLAPFKSVHAARPGYLSVVEAQRLINATAGAFRNMVHAALLTGCRYGELCALDVRDLQRGKLHIKKSKNGRSRDVVLTDEGIAFFKRLAAGRAAAEPMLHYIERWRPRQQVPLMRNACRAARIAPAISFHELRHTWASLAIMGGLPLVVAARQLGHRDTRMCEIHYGHLCESFVDREIRAAAPTYGIDQDARFAALTR